jgi:N-hydroxyarylamine O-acetyltransferase
VNIEKYLARIDYEGPSSPTLDLLKTLQKKHLLSVPFENLDIHYKVPIELDLEKIFDKVVNRKRGGFCCELNGLFYELLRTIGFEAKMISARVFSQKKQDFSPEYDHLAIIARVNSRDYLVDVGFGEFALEPLVMDLNEKQIDQRGVFMIGKHDDTYYEGKNLADEKWVSVYMFSLK